MGAFFSLWVPFSPYGCLFLLVGSFFSLYVGPFILTTSPLPFTKISAAPPPLQDDKTNENRVFPACDKGDVTPVWGSRQGVGLVWVEEGKCCLGAGVDELQLPSRGRGWDRGDGA